LNVIVIVYGSVYGSVFMAAWLRLWFLVKQIQDKIDHLNTLFENLVQTWQQRKVLYDQNLDLEVSLRLCSQPYAKNRLTAEERGWWPLPSYIMWLYIAW